MQVWCCHGQKDSQHPYCWAVMLCCILMPFPVCCSHSAAPAAAAWGGRASASQSFLLPLTARRHRRLPPDLVFRADGSLLCNCHQISAQASRNGRWPWHPTA